MNHLIMTLPFIVYSLIILALLTHTDPRRQKVFKQTDNVNAASMTLSLAARKRLAWSLLLPFIPLVLMGNVAGVLMYAGALTVFGWLLAELPKSVI